MPMSERRISVDVLRDAADRAVKATSLRRAALAVGLSPTGLRSFIDGAEPFESTRQKLTTWYLRRVASGEEAPVGAVADAALSLLTDHLPPKEREELRREIAALVRKKSKAAGVEPPEWTEG